MIPHISTPPGSAASIAATLGSAAVPPPTELHMEVDWDLGVSGHDDDLAETEQACGIALRLHSWVKAFSQGIRWRTPWTVRSQRLIVWRQSGQHGPAAWRAMSAELLICRPGFNSRARFLSGG